MEKNCTTEPAFAQERVQLLENMEDGEKQADRKQLKRKRERRRSQTLCREDRNGIYTAYPQHSLKRQSMEKGEGGLELRVYNSITGTLDI